ncbi:hypothetical protein PEBR_35300 [Penicillium brasilianum]|uniref:Zn(II)2Cys6 transcription factor n=1 Tax=Penicillium brasilianum TaxID=104259 RepID=A0A1S9RCM6_PENBI|nr:hypothetical protein PEBR_35300 [Penicillium brasilianum]
MGKRCVPVHLGNNSPSSHGQEIHRTQTPIVTDPVDEPVTHCDEVATTSQSSTNDSPKPGRVETCRLIEEPVHNHTDALNALLRAARSPSPTKRPIGPQTGASVPRGSTARPAEHASSRHSRAYGAVSLSNLQLRCESTDAWKKCWLVRNNWLRAGEAAWYISQFFKTLAPMTPILSDYFDDPSTHELLVVYEPILCYTILSISSMYHCPSEEYASPGSALIHSKSWSIVKSLCTRVFWAEEHGSASKLRTYGTVLAILLLVEWPPNAIYLPPDDMVDYVFNDDVPAPGTRNHTAENLEDLERHLQIDNATQWMADLSRPIIRSDRISSALLGMAQTLYNELDIASASSTHLSDPSPNHPSNLEQRYVSRNARACLLLHIYDRQSSISSRSPATRYRDGITISQAELHMVDTGTSEKDRDSMVTVHSWEKMSRIACDFQQGLLELDDECITAVVASVAKQAAQIELSRASISRLERWREEIHMPPDSSPVRHILEIEYHNIYMQLTSAAIQSASTQILEQLRSRQAETCFEDGLIKQHGLHVHDFGNDTRHLIERGMDSAKSLLTAVIGLANQELLRTMPLRVFTRVAFAATLLLKATCIDPTLSRVAASFEIIDKTRQKLEIVASTKMHMAHNTARLIYLHVTQLHLLLAACKRAENSRFDHRETCPTGEEQIFPDLPSGDLGTSSLNGHADESLQNATSGQNASTWGDGLYGGLPSQDNWMQDFEFLWSSILSGNTPVGDWLYHEGHLESDNRRPA